MSDVPDSLSNLSPRQQNNAYLRYLESMRENIQSIEEIIEDLNEILADDDGQPARDSDREQLLNDAPDRITRVRNALTELTTVASRHITQVGLGGTAETDWLNNDPGGGAVSGSQQYEQAIDLLLHELQEMIDNYDGVAVMLQNNTDYNLGTPLQQIRSDIDSGTTDDNTGPEGTPKALKGIITRCISLIGTFDIRVQRMHNSTADNAPREVDGTLATRYLNFRNTTEAALQEIEHHPIWSSPQMRGRTAHEAIGQTATRLKTMLRERIKPVTGAADRARVADLDELVSGLGDLVLAMNTALRANPTRPANLEIFDRTPAHQEEEDGWSTWSKIKLISSGVVGAALLALVAVGFHGCSGGSGEGGSGGGNGGGDNPDNARDIDHDAPLTLENLKASREGDTIVFRAPKRMPKEKVAFKVQDKDEKLVLIPMGGYSGGKVEFELPKELHGTNPIRVSLHCQEPAGWRHREISVSK